MVSRSKAGIPIIMDNKQCHRDQPRQSQFTITTPHAVASPPALIEYTESWNHIPTKKLPINTDLVLYYASKIFRILLYQ